MKIFVIVCEHIRKRTLREYEKIILDASKTKRNPFNFSPDFMNNIPEEGGVYVFFNEDNKIVYVGESRNLRARIKNLKHLRKHILRRKIKAELSSKNIGKSVKESLEELKVVIVPIPFGRKEIEEFLINRHNPKYNKIK